METSLNISNETLETSMQRLREKYRKKTKEALRSYRNRHDLNSFTCRMCSTKFAVYKKKINDLLSNNNELAKSLENFQQENARLEQQLAEVQQQLLYKSTLQSKLMDVSSQLNIAVTAIVNSVSSISDIKKQCFNSSRRNMSEDIISSEDNSLKLPESQSPGVYSTSAEYQSPQLNAYNLLKRNRSKPILDISTVFEVSSILTDETESIPFTTTVNNSPVLSNNSPSDEAKMFIPKIISNQSTPENKILDASEETPKTPVLSSNYFLQDKSPELFKSQDLEVNSQKNENVTLTTPGSGKIQPSLLSEQYPPRKSKVTIVDKSTRQSSLFPEHEKENINDLSDFGFPSNKKKVKKLKRGRPKGSTSKKQTTENKDCIFSEEASHRSPIAKIENLVLPVSDNGKHSNTFSPSINNSPLQPQKLHLSLLPDKLSFSTEKKTPRKSRIRTSRFKESLSSDISSSSSIMASPNQDSVRKSRRKLVSYREPSSRAKLRRPL